MPDNKNYSKIRVKNKERVSGFLVDLKKITEEKEFFEKEEASRGFLKKNREKLRKVIKTKGSHEGIADYQKTDDFYEDKIGVNALVEPEQAPYKESLLKKFTELSFIQFFVTFYLFTKQLISLFAKVFYRTGWLVVFFVRFFYFFFYKIFSLIADLLNTIFIGNKRKSSVIWQEDYRPAIPLNQNSSGSQINLKIEESYFEESGEVKSREVSERFYNGSKESTNPEQILYTATPPEIPNLYSVPAYNKVRAQKFSLSDILPKPRAYYLKSVFYFSLFMIILVLPFKAATYYQVLKDLGGRVLGVSEEAIGDIKSAGSLATDFDFYQAGQRFAEASGAFVKAQEDIDIVSTHLRLLSSVIPNQKLLLAADANLFLEAGAISSRIGEKMSFIFDAFSQEKEKSIKAVFNAFFDNIDIVLSDINLLNSALAKVDIRGIPEEFRGDFILLKDKSVQIEKSFLELSDLLDKIRLMLGFEGEKRYLLIFQNNAEMRASGGFIGSFSIVDIRDGEIINIETPKGGAYDTEGAFYEKVIAPEPLHIVNPSWHLWDANWWPDWKKTAKKLSWFYEKSGGSSVDGVIALTPIVVERLLSIIGELDMRKSHGVVINAENFWEITQTFAEEKPIGHPAYEPLPYQPEISDAEETQNELASQDDNSRAGYESKKIIGDLIELIKNEVPNRLNKEMFLELFSSAEKSLSEKHILLYLNDWRLQSKFEELGWAGRTAKTALDYLMVVNSNISGFKSDRKIEQEINHVSEVMEDGSIVNILKIKRTHTGIKGEKFSGHKNLNWMRIYVPLGSQFVEAKGFWPPEESLFEKPDPSWKNDPDLKNSEENFIRDRDSWTKIYNEDDKTVFANWTQVEPGESVEVYIKYILPFRLPANGIEIANERPYSLLAEKQPGSLPSKIKSLLILPGERAVNWHYPDNINVSKNGWSIEDDLSVDKFWAIKIK
jgi:hypothetical protein